MRALLFKALAHEIVQRGLVQTLGCALFRAVVPGAPLRATSEKATGQETLSVRPLQPALIGSLLTRVAKLARLELGNARLGLLALGERRFALATLHIGFLRSARNRRARLALGVTTPRSA